MKSLGLAFVIVAAVGSAVYFLFAYLLHAQEYAGAISALIFGALPIIHQELEKQSAKSATSGIVSQTWPNPGNPIEPPEKSQTIPSPAPVSNSPTAAPPASDPPPSVAYQSAAPYPTTPVPVYVSDAPAMGTMESPAQNLPVQNRGTAPQTKGAISQTRSANWVVTLVYGIAIVIAVRGASDFTRLLDRWYEGLPGDGLDVVYVFIGSWLPLLIVGVGVFLVGLWVGLKSPHMGWLITIGAVVLGLLLARLINMIVGYDETNAFLNDYLLPRDQASVDWRFANTDGYDRLYLSLTWAFTLGVAVVESVVALAGYWIGKRQKNAKDSR
jgi:hypothetical protein